MPSAKEMTPQKVMKAAPMSKGLFSRCAMGNPQVIAANPRIINGIY
jgi:hypothetical protein